MENRDQHLEARLALLEERVHELQARNIRVESEKAWEVSRARIVCVAAVTYLTTAAVFCAIGASQPALAALIPTIGYLLSTQSLPVVKSRWIGQRNTSQGKRL